MDCRDIRAFTSLFEGHYPAVTDIVFIKSENALASTGGRQPMHQNMSCRLI